MVLASCFMLEVNTTKANGMTIRKMVMVFTLTKMDLHISDLGKMT